MASQTTQLIVELLDRVSGPARGVADGLRGITRTVRDATGGPITLADRLDAAISRNNRAIDAAPAAACSTRSERSMYVLKNALSAPIASAQRCRRALAELGAKGNLSAGRLKDIGSAAGTPPPGQPVRHRHHPGPGLPRRHGTRRRAVHQGHAVDRQGGDRHGGEPKISPRRLCRHV